MVEKSIELIYDDISIFKHNPKKRNKMNFQKLIDNLDYIYINNFFMKNILDNSFANSFVKNNSNNKILIGFNKDFLNNNLNIKKSDLIVSKNNVFFINFQNNFYDMTKDLHVIFSLLNSVDKNFKEIETDGHLLKDSKFKNIKEIKNIKGIIMEDNKNLNKIYYGAPGTGKSYKIKELNKNVDKENIFRTMFHEEYSYFDFIGQYKPVVGYKADLQGYFDQNNELVKNKLPIILYDYVEGVFLKSYIKAYELLSKDVENKNVYLIIEELNRGNCSSIFGNIFQLLDRNEEGFSEYPIKIEIELEKYLENKNIEGMPTKELIIPSNLNIISTMNTSDQSLFPIDSAFKRRWDMEYIKINYKTKELQNIKIEKIDVLWLDFLEKINNLIVKHLESENKLIGQWFLKMNNKNEIPFNDFNNKLLHYLFFDVFRHHRSEVFKDVVFSNLINKDNLNDIFKDDLLNS